VGISSLYDLCILNVRAPGTEVRALPGCCSWVNGDTAGVLELHTGVSDIEVYPLYADPDGMGRGAGSVTVSPKRRYAYHTNLLGSSYYTHAMLYSPVIHVLKVSIILPEVSLRCRVFSVAAAAAAAAAAYCS
jgi:hypothetical protein